MLELGQRQCGRAASAHGDVVVSPDKQHRPTLAAATRWLACCLLGWMLTATGGAGAQTEAVEPTPEQVKAFVQNKTDPVVGAWIERNLQQNGSAAIAKVAATDATESAETRRTRRPGSSTRV